jgi:hypothetical protein
MTLALRRFALDGIGPPGARFDPLTVDVTLDGAGATDDPTAEAARTAVLFLENGGGKSVLLRLLFSVVLPGRRYTVGSAKLDGYVGSGDTGHVALEWQTGDGTLVTGTLLEWRNRTRSSSGSNLLQLWYSFVPWPGVLTLDALPTRDGDRRVTRSGFRERLAALAREHPALELVVEDSPTKWADHLLRSTPLDPETFRYQRQMNADEADAESLFSGLRTDEDFVRFVAEAVHDPEQVDGFGDLVVGYAGQLGQREHHETEARFCTEAAAVLRPLDAAASGLGAARSAAARARRSTDALRGRLTAAVTAAAADAAARRDGASRLAARASALEAESKRVSDVAAELRRLEARFRHDAAVEAEQQARDDKRDAELTLEAWRAVETIVSVQALSAEVDRLRAAQEAAEHDLAPLRLAAEMAAARYAGRLLAEADALAAEATDAEAAAAEANRAAEEQARRATASARSASAAAADSRSLRGRAAEVDERVDAARSDGLVAPGESVRAAAQRGDAARRDASAALDRVRTRQRTLGDDRQRLGRAQADAVLAHERAVAQLDLTRRELDDHLARAAALVGHDRVQQLAPGADDAWVVAATVDQALDRSVLAAEAEVRNRRGEIDVLDARLERLGADGLLPPPTEVERVLDAVVAAGVGAATGWRVLAHNFDHEGRARILARNPALAGGVVVSDAARLDEAVAAVADAGVETESVVLVGTTDQLDEPGAGRAAPVRPALYDPDWTERVRESLLAERAAADAARDAASATLAVDQPLLDKVRELLRRCPADRRDRFVSSATELAGEAASTAARVAELDGRVAAAQTTLDELAGELPLREADDRAAESRHRRLVELEDQCRRADGWRAEAATAETEATEHEGDAQRAEDAAGLARYQAEAQRARARQAAADADERRVLASRTSDAPEPAPVQAATGVLRADADAARDVYETERAGRDLTPQVQAAEAQLSVHADRRAALSTDVRAEAEGLAGSPDADEERARRARIDEARRALQLCDERLSGASKLVGAAKRTLEDRTPRSGGRQRHAVLDPDAEPADADDAARRAAEQQERFQHLTQQVRDAHTEAAEQTSRAQAAASRAKLLEASIGALPPVSDPALSGAGDGAEPWEAGEDEAMEAARAARQAYDQAEATLTAADRRMADADVAVRQVANDPSFAGVAGVRVALAGEPIDSLARRAASLADELDDMRRSIEAELADVLRHREGLVQRLATLVEAQLRQLRQLTRLSTLPDGLGDWSGKPFISVEFEQVSAAEITARLGAVVDEAAVATRPRPPLDIILAGMRAAVTQRRGDHDRTFRVRLLRPNRTMTYERATIGELEREFSGGMKLTAAICTYCSLAALRATSRSTGSLFGVAPGPLFLDNPLGKASADYLLELQHRIAAKLGVQLVHTTGVWDVEALATYERVVRLRNLADLRRNIRRLRVDDEVHLPGTGATVDAVAFSVRRPAS